MTRTNHDRMRDAVLYVLISSVVIIILVAVALNRVSEYTTLKWFAFSMFTGVIFGLFISHSRPLWRKRQFWAFVGSLMSLHTVGLPVTHAPWRSDQTDSLGSSDVCRTGFAHGAEISSIWDSSPGKSRHRTSQLTLHHGPGAFYRRHQYSAREKCFQISTLPSDVGCDQTAPFGTMT